METDYSYYAILHEAHHGEGEPSVALQLLSALGMGTWLLERVGGMSGRHQLVSTPLPRATTSSTPCLSPRELILGGMKPCTKDISSWLWVEPQPPAVSKPSCRKPTLPATP